MEKILKAFKGHIRVNSASNTVELYTEYGVKMVLRNLDTETINEFKKVVPVV